MFAVVLLPIGALGQMKLKVDKEKPIAGEIVTIEVDVHPGPNSTISWTKESGDGEFVGETIDQSKVSFRPKKAGDTINIACEIKTPDGDFRLRTKLVVSGQASSPPGKTLANGQIDSSASPPPSQPAVHAQVAGILALESIDYIVPSGYMGDAMSENGETAQLDPGHTSNCHSHSSCYSLEYKSGKVGWAAFAWQRVPEGSMNWGENPGADLSSGGYQSLRVWARGELSPTGGTPPKAQFKSGGNVAPKYSSSNAASYVVAGPTVELGATWKEYCLSLEGKSLKNVVSPFTVVVTKAGNPKGAVVVLDDIRFSKSPCPASQ